VLSVIATLVPADHSILRSFALIESKSEPTIAKLILVDCFVPCSFALIESESEPECRFARRARLFKHLTKCLQIPFGILGMQTLPTMSKCRQRRFQRQRHGKEKQGKSQAEERGVQGGCTSLTTSRQNPSYEIDRGSACRPNNWEAETWVHRQADQSAPASTSLVDSRHCERRTPAAEEGDGIGFWVFFQTRTEPSSAGFGGKNLVSSSINHDSCGLIIIRHRVSVTQSSHHLSVLLPSSFESGFSSNGASRPSLCSGHRSQHRPL
jgi:hypothetical protein